MSSPSQAPQGVVLPNTEVHRFTSTLNQQTYQLFVSLPPSYASGGQHYPVIYQLDANIQFALMAQTCSLLQLTGEIPEAILVGVGYPTEDFATLFRWRALDMTPTHAPQEEEAIKALYGMPIDSGGAEAFKGVFEHEIFPYIAQHFRTASPKVFAGHSYGGLFGAYVLCTQPTMFQRYLLGSPSLEWDGYALLGFEATYAAAHKALPAKVFLSVGADEGDDMVAPLHRFCDQLARRQYAELSYSTVIFEQETHASVIPATFSRGLRMLLGAET